MEGEGWMCERPKGVSYGASHRAIEDKDKKGGRGTGMWRGQRGLVIEHRTEPSIFEGGEDGGLRERGEHVSCSSFMHLWTVFLWICLHVSPTVGLLTKS